MQIHIVLVSGQTIPNLIPALMERPGSAYLVATGDMQRKGLARRLTGILAKSGTQSVVIDGAPDADYMSILAFAASVAARVEREQPAAEIALNATGGNKLMALGFIEVFRGRGARVIYADTAHSRIEYLPAVPGNQAGSVPMSDVLDVATYLTAQGFEVESARSDDAVWRKAAADRREACAYLARAIKDPGVQILIGMLNVLAHKALDRDRALVAPEQEFDSEPRAPWPDVLARLNDFGLLTLSGRKLTFASESAACFLHGDWLEEFAWHVVGDAKPFDFRLGVKGRWQGTRSATNEFDVLATHMNELLFIECKTVKHGREDAKDADILYKADSLGQDARGLFGTTWLITARKPEPEMIGRASQQGVTLLGPAEIARLGGHVQNWMRRTAPRR